ncbi:MAG: FecR domain-containing protein [Fibrobacterota bacterium]
MRNVLIFMLLSFSFVWSAPVGKITFFIGSVEIQKSGASNRIPAIMGIAVNSGDAVMTGEEEFAEITLKDGSIMRVGEKSELVLKGSDENRTPSLKKGRVWANIKKLGKRTGDFKVHTGTAVAAIRGTVFKVEKNQNDSTSTVSVFEGNVDVGPDADLRKKLKKNSDSSNKNERTEISGPVEVPGPYEVTLDEWVNIVKGMQINVRPDGKYHKFKMDEESIAADKFIKINKERDAKLEKTH